MSSGCLLTFFFRFFILLTTPLFTSILQRHETGHFIDTVTNLATLLPDLDFSELEMRLFNQASDRFLLYRLFIINSDKNGDLNFLNKIETNAETSEENGNSLLDHIHAIHMKSHGFFKLNSKPGETLAKVSALVEENNWTRLIRLAPFQKHH